MTNTEHTSNIKVIATLKALPVLIFIATLIVLPALMIWDGNSERSLYYSVFGNALFPLIVVCAAIGSVSFIQMYRWRDAYLRHDAITLFRGWWDTWPITDLSNFYIATNWLGIRSLRAHIGNRDIELFKAYFVIEDVEVVLAKLQALQKQ
jgi:hypothetical protein